MIGASKINHTTDDLERLKVLFNTDLSDMQISNLFTTNSGLKISRGHISKIRKGTRWNSSMRSFLMKDELTIDMTVSTSLWGQTYRTVVSILSTETDQYYVYLTYVDNKPMIWGNVSPMVNKPLRNELIDNHFKFINEYTRTS